ncbi:hypothetical protein QCA50_015696 [Cerrena zonata]|uniref:Translation initiation factor beta propellor-like domain-containing protein n=1 Tax=Cerrena zonata TaxID=2478898 RepID=A0AAW0FSV3_9APHY
MPSETTFFDARVCEWSPCGRFILTATTSPRLRVDNGLKIWHALELYSISWKPQAIEKFPALKELEAAPEAHESAKEYLNAKQLAQANAAKKPAGAYRPPHARNSGRSSIATTLYEKEKLANGSSQQSQQQGTGVVGATGRQKIIPGVAPVTNKESKSASKNRRKREAKKNELTSPAESPVPTLAAPATTTTPSTTTPEVGSVVGGVSSLEEKKIRSLLKKLRAIESLKMKQANGEPLEDTQVNKIQKEDEIRKELTSLGWSD